MSDRLLEQLDEVKSGPDDGQVPRVEMVDLAYDCADEIRRLRRKCNRLRFRANASEKAASAAMLIAKTTIRCSIELERDLRKECEEKLDGR